MGCDQCWPGNCTGACDPAEQVKSLRLMADQARKVSCEQLKRAAEYDREAGRIEREISDAKGS